MTKEKVTIGNNTFEIIDEIVLPSPFEEYKDVRVIVYKTSTGIDFVKIVANDEMIGIQAERAYFTLRYEGFEKKEQALLEIQRGEGTVHCDEIIVENPITGEQKTIYYDIESFFGKFDESLYE